mmetsp:Transcript_143602/g.459369  ORF Transcript_143602/g.459369 Transcript_143602/m.459369 type:complete len:458 (-) Transcript_143602:163-1536(-)
MSTPTLRQTSGHLAFVAPAGVAPPLAGRGVAVQLSAKFSAQPQSPQETSAASPLLAGLAIGAVGAVASVHRRARQPSARALVVQLAAAAGKSDAAARVQDAIVVEETPVAEADPKKYQQCESVLCCPVCQTKIGSMGSGGKHCKVCGIDFPYESEGNFVDLTIGASKPHIDGSAPRYAAKEEKSSSKPLAKGFLQNLPFVKTGDAIAKSLGLPQSQEIESLGLELLRDPSKVFNRSAPVGTGTFQSPLVSFAYERGWRSSFAASGFPGVDEEFRLAQDFLAESCGVGAHLLDASCGSGLFCRRFAATGRYGSVTALDYSSAMLRQVDDFAVKELGANYGVSSPTSTALTLVRADIARLPFATSSLDGVHAGAAIHCWPAPENGVAEVARVLKPGGVFVLTTFRPGGRLRGESSNSNGFRLWTEEDLRDLTRQCGLVDFEAIKRDPSFIMVRCRKRAA